MVIGFNQQFVESILSGSKIHTIREDKTNRWSPGKIMHMDTGVRTKQYKEFNLEICQSVQSIEIHFHNNFFYNRVIIDNRELSIKEIKRFTQNDGFENVCDFLFWFEDKAENDVYKGKIIHWTDLKY